MSTTLKRIAAGAAASIVGALTVSVVTAAPAEAVCYGRNSGTAIGNYVNGRIIATERHQTGTCDGDDVYNGQLQDNYNDGYAARVWYKDGSYDGVVAYASTTAWVGYRFYDQNGDSYSIMSIYAGPGTKSGGETANFGF